MKSAIASPVAILFAAVLALFLIGTAQAAKKPKPIPRWTEASADARMNAYAKTISPIKEATLGGDPSYKFLPHAGCFSTYSGHGEGRVKVRPRVWVKTYDRFSCIVYVLIPKTPESEYDEAWEGVNIDVQLKVTGKKTFRLLSCEVEEASHVGLVPKCERTVIE